MPCTEIVREINDALVRTSKLASIHQEPVDGQKTNELPFDAVTRAQEEIRSVPMLTTNDTAQEVFAPVRCERLRNLTTHSSILR